MLKLSSLNIGRMARHDRISKAIAECPFDRGTIASRLGVSKAALSQWESGQTKSLKPENLFGLADITACSARWLATGEGPQHTPDGIYSVAERPAIYGKIPARLSQLVAKLLKLEEKKELSDSLINAIDAVISAANAGPTTATKQGSRIAPTATIAAAGVGGDPEFDLVLNELATVVERIELIKRQLEEMPHTNPH